MHQFNSEFYVAAVTAIPIFFVSLAVEIRGANAPIMRRMFALYLYRKLRRFESFRERLHFLFRGFLVLLTAVLPVVAVVGWASEIAGIFALDRQTATSPTHLMVLIGVISLPTLVLVWAIVLREREPTPIDADLEALATKRREAIDQLERRLQSIEAGRSHIQEIAEGELEEARRRLTALTRRNQSLSNLSSRVGRALRALGRAEEVRNQESDKRRG